MIDKRGDLIKLLLFVLIGILLVSFGSAATFTNVVSNCAAENSATKGSFGSACSVTTGSSLQLDDASLETHTYQKNNYGGVRIQSVNSSIADCGSITSVNICYKWWRTSGAAALDCDISVDANGGASYTSAITSCTAFTSEPAGITCTDVTSLETWTCANFFGASGTRAFAKSEMTRVTTGGTTTETGTWDALYFNVSYTNNNAPTISNITLSTSLIKGGNQLLIYANTTSNGVNDSNANTLTLYCSNSTNTPTVADNVCSGTDSTYPYDLTCAYNTKSISGNETVYCRVYDGITYSANTVNATYAIDATPPILSIVSVAGDSSAPYFDSNGTDSITSVNISGEAGMSCRWGSSDVAYSSMASSCTTNGAYSICNFSDVLSQGSTTRYISCQDTLTNENNATNNLDVLFTLDYTAPTTSDNSITSFQVPPYIVTITESDNVDSALTILTYYCTDTTGTCTPTTPIDSGGTVTFTNLNRGRNYLRYYSVDGAGNTQSTQNKTINIDRLPVFTSATDNSSSIKGGAMINVTTVSSDSDSGQGITLFVCNSTSATSSGCTHTQYCTASGTANLTCIFASEVDTSAHTWYAFLYDDLSEAAIANPLSGSYISDSTGPAITIISPANTTYPGVNVTAEISNSESSVWAGYSLDGESNVSMTNISATSFTASLTNLAYGGHNITFYANDSYGNYGVSAIRYFTIETPVDVTAPSLTIVSPSNGSYTSATGTYINISSDEALSWAGYRLNGGNLTNLTSASSTIWYINLTSLNQESTNTIVVYGNDSSGNQGNRTAVFYADSLAPRYSSVNVSPSLANVSQPSGVNCSISWNDTNIISSVVIGENSLGSYENHTISFSGSSGVASYVIVGAKLSSPGNYTCRFYATDIAGNMNSTSQEFTVNDITAPIITATSPSLEGVYNQLNILLSFVSNENLVSGWYYVNSTGINTTMGNTSLTGWNSTFSGTNLQSYLVIFYGNDSFGNIGASSTITFSINTGATDSVPPVLTATILNATYKSSATIPFNVSSNEALNWSGYTLNGGSLTNLTNLSSTLWNGTLSGLTSGSTNTLVIYGNDSANNKGNSTIVFYFDNEAPQFSSSSATPSIANETQNVVCSSDISDDFALNNVKISENATSPGNFINHTIDLSVSGNANYTILNVVKGNYTCLFYATDVAGNADSDSVIFSVNDVTSPVLTINSPIAQNYSASSILFSLTTSENASSAWYSLDNGATNISLIGSGVSWSKISSVADGSYTVRFYANDSFGNIGTANVNIVVDTSVNDGVAPVITIWSPINGSYDLDGTVLLNMTSDEALSWAGYRNNSGPLTNLGNVSNTNWNSTVVFAEGTHIVAFYGNDTRTAPQNQGNRTSVVYVDLSAPNASIYCDSIVNDSNDLNCDINASDIIGLDYAILSYNFSGSFVNTSGIDLSGTSDSASYIFDEGNYTPGGYTVLLYLFDLSGRVNSSSSANIGVLDDIAPLITNIIYSPNTTADLDPNVNVTINASITEDYSISSVEVYYKNSSDLTWTSIDMTNTSLIEYNGTIEFGAGNWTFYANATDAQGNINISSNYTLIVQNDLSQNITTNITSIKSFTYAQRSSSNELGYVLLNTTSDTSLNYNVTISAEGSILSRFDINNTLNQSENYTSASGDVLYIPLKINLTDLTAALYSFNITVVSEAGTEVIERNLNIQLADGPYLVVTLIDYSSSVTRGQTDVEFSATVENLGTISANDVYLNWTLPLGFSLASGSLNAGPSTLGVGSSGTNSITLDVSSAITDSNLIIYANASSSNANSSYASKIITITDPLVVTVTTPGTSSSSGGGGGGGGATTASYSNEIEFVRGETDSFKIPVTNRYSNTTLRNLVLNLTGFPEQYVEIYPSIINEIKYNETKYFTINLKVPSYKESYEEHKLIARITGSVDDITDRAYSETQNILLIIQEISKEQANNSLIEAELAVSDMAEAGFNIEEVQKLLVSASDKLNVNRRNKESYDISSQIISIKEKAFSVSDTIKRIIIVLQNPKKLGVLTGGVVADTLNRQSFSDLLNQENKVKQSIAETNTVPDKYKTITGMALTSIVEEVTINQYKEIKELTLLAIAAFDRGDYSLAEERASNAKALLLLQLKGNFILFLYSYWYFVLLALVVLSITGTITLKVYRRSTISQKIASLDKEEQTILALIKDTQEKYFAGNISGSAYHTIMQQHQERLAKLKKNRMTLRNKRVKLIAPSEISVELNSEKAQTEKEIMKIQESFYRDKKINESEYKTQFETMNERLAELEEETLTLDIKSRKEKKQSNKVISDNVLEKKQEIKARDNKQSLIEKIKDLFVSGERKREELRKAKIKEMLSKK